MREDLCRNCVEWLTDDDDDDDDDDDGDDDDGASGGLMQVRLIERRAGDP